MIKWNDKTYSGNIVNEGNDKLTVVIYTVESLQDICLSLNDVTEVIEETQGERVVNVTMALSVKTIEQNTYYITFSTKPSQQQEMMDLIQEQSDAIDALLIMLLEG